jgi:hypothetical protein
MTVLEVTVDLDRLLEKLVEYEHNKRLRGQYETRFLERLECLKKEPSHVWKPYVLAYARYQKW